MIDEDVRIEDAIRALSSEITVRDLLDEIVVELRELRCQMNRIELQLQPKEIQMWYSAGTTWF